MNAALRDDVTHEAEITISRRNSLAPLGALALLASGTNAAAAKGKKGGNSTRKARKRAKKKCQQQVDSCRSILGAFCAENGCAEGFVDCCDLFETCDSGQAITCMFPSEV